MDQNLQSGNDNSNLATVENLKKYFSVRKSIFTKQEAQVKAVDGISFNIKKGETLGLVGESGCGKTTAGRAILRLIEPTEGLIHFEGKNLMELDKRQMKEIRRDMQIIFQDPYSSLNPRMTVGTTIAESLRINKIGESKECMDRVIEILKKVGLRDFHCNRYPHEFSGGQLQRIGIARALILKPKFIVCDEPVSALDVSVQSQVLNILNDLQDEFELTYLFIAHNLAVVEHISDRVAVMYLGKFVELASSEELYSNPLHPYTQALMSAIPIPDPTLKRQRILLKGDVPSSQNIPSGCRFHQRCPKAFEQCELEEPPLEENNLGHQVACWLVTFPNIGENFEERKKEADY
jgi:peptide/nickel transport system ATP-binding protein/oligopeptide transport system ATP-binding protein